MARGSWISKEAAIDAMLGVGFVSATASLAIHLPNPELPVAMRLYAQSDAVRRRGLLGARIDARPREGRASRF